MSENLTMDPQSQKQPEVSQTHILYTWLNKYKGSKMDKIPHIQYSNHLQKTMFGFGCASVMLKYTSCYILLDYLVLSKGLHST